MRGDWLFLGGGWVAALEPVSEQEGRLSFWTRCAKEPEWRGAQGCSSGEVKAGAGYVSSPDPPSPGVPLGLLPRSEARELCPQAASSMPSVGLSSASRP